MKNTPTGLNAPLQTNGRPFNGVKPVPPEQNNPQNREDNRGKKYKFSILDQSFNLDLFVGTLKNVGINVNPTGLKNDPKTSEVGREGPETDKKKQQEKEEKQTENKDSNLNVLNGSQDVLQSG